MPPNVPAEGIPHERRRGEVLQSSFLGWSHKISALCPWSSLDAGAGHAAAHADPPRCNTTDLSTRLARCGGLHDDFVFVTRLMRPFVVVVIPLRRHVPGSVFLGLLLRLGFILHLRLRFRVESQSLAHGKILDWGRFTDPHRWRRVARAQILGLLRSFSLRRNLLLVVLKQRNIVQPSHHRRGRGLPIVLLFPAYQRRLRGRTPLPLSPAELRHAWRYARHPSQLDHLVRSGVQPRIQVHRLLRHHHQRAHGGPGSLLGRRQRRRDSGPRVLVLTLLHLPTVQNGLYPRHNFRHHLPGRLLRC
mmetsp:Transcript_96992/g.222187  ORF Transcript_96992/g.222187 Transcript_96992/m.222187 type:complete len:303 (+) Transcript_96992:856-1764(+)